MSKGLCREMVEVLNHGQYLSSKLSAKSSSHLVALVSLKSLFIYFFQFCLRVAHMACESSQDRGRNRAIAAGLHHSRSNTGSESHLRPTPQFTAVWDP